MTWRDRRENRTHTAAVREAKAVQTRDTNVPTVLLHPYIGSNLSAHLLVDSARIPGLGQLVRHGTAKNASFSVARGLYLNRHAHVEGASNPITLGSDDTAISISEIQVVPGKSFNRWSLRRQLSAELLQCRREANPNNDVFVSCFCILKGDDM
ncbi:hypothetical protein CTA1_5310 [Colletotrichum tanaceti]|uniref:Uncharacterized protein n=1 Tax=Colletotrichum tanaceti TaxID=1306861 RepID=A0A4U6XAU1_9PEZI|nr:hypothetical protein CTA1_5310 [Colletotrichum tanaceti]